ncbi:MAG: hypothetical protein AAF939_01305 [Planctomycetota bacterium]
MLFLKNHNSPDHIAVAQVSCLSRQVANSLGISVTDNFNAATHAIVHVQDEKLNSLVDRWKGFSGARSIIVFRVSQGDPVDIENQAHSSFKHPTKDETMLFLLNARQHSKLKEEPNLLKAIVAIKPEQAAAIVAGNLVGKMPDFLVPREKRTLKFVEQLAEAGVVAVRDRQLLVDLFSKLDQAAQKAFEAAGHKNESKNKVVKALPDVRAYMSLRKELSHQRLRHLVERMGPAKDVACGSLELSEAPSSFENLREWLIENWQRDADAAGNENEDKLPSMIKRLLKHAEKIAENVGSDYLPVELHDENNKFVSPLLDSHGLKSVSDNLQGFANSINALIDNLDSDGGCNTSLCECIKQATECTHKILDGLQGGIYL